MQQMKLARAPWSMQKLARKSAKQVLWISFAGLTGMTFVGFFSPIDGLAGKIAAADLSGWEAFWIIFYGFATYGNAGYLREQVCKYMCPYARFQSAMFDKDTLIIGYDPARGEPRGSRPRKADPAKLGLGACIDCGLCVQVCPTGIDIRQGLQYECIGCAACIDVCDGVMDKMAYPRGLIRYDTEHGLDAKLSRRELLRRLFRPRVLVYSAVLVLIVLAFLFALAMRPPFRVDVVRDRASLARLVDDGAVENVYRLQVMNATEQPQRLRLAVRGLPGITLSTAPDLQLAPTEARWVTAAVRVPAESALQAGPGAHVIHFQVEQPSAGGQGAAVDAVLSERSTFVVPR